MTNIMPMWVCHAGLAGCVLVTLSASLAEAEYGPRTTVGANYQQTSTTRSTDGINDTGCSGIGVCRILFQQAPAQQRLIIQHVSCRVPISAGFPLHAYLGTRKGQSFPLKRSWLVLANTSPFHFAVNSPVMHLVNSGERPLVLFNNSQSHNWIGLECNISGQLKQP